MAIAETVALAQLGLASPQSCQRKVPTSTNDKDNEVRSRWLSARPTRKAMKHGPASPRTAPDKKPERDATPK